MFYKVIKTLTKVYENLTKPWKQLPMGSCSHSISHSPKVLSKQKHGKCFLFISFKFLLIMYLKFKTFNTFQHKIVSSCPLGKKKLAVLFTLSGKVNKQLKVFTKKSKRRTYLLVTAPLILTCRHTF